MGSPAPGALAFLTDAVPVVQSTADRTTKFATPPLDQRVWNKGTGNVERWNGSLWVVDSGGVQAALGWYNVQDAANGAAKADKVNDDSVAINGTIATAAAAQGGIIYLPTPTFGGGYLCLSTIAMPPTSTVTLILQGGGARSTYLFGGTQGMGQIVRMGSNAPDASGTFTQQIFYCGIRDLSISGTLLNTGSTTGLQLTEPQRCFVEHVIIEQLDFGASIGLYLLGSTTAGGISAAAAPHCWRSYFLDITVATTMRPCVLQNADENTIDHCNFGVPTGLGALAQDSVIAVEIVQGRNNRFRSLLCSGDDANLTPNLAFKCDQPVHGDVAGNSIQGWVAEGFDLIFQVGGTSAIANEVHNLDAAVFNTLFDNAGYPAGATDPRNETVFDAPLHNVYYRSGVEMQNNGHAVALAAGANTLDVTKTNVYYLTGNAGGSTIATCSTTVGGAQILEGRTIKLKFADSLVTLIDASQGGGANFRLWGRSNLVGAVDSWVELHCTGGTWYQISPLMTNTLTVAFPIPTGTVRPVTNKSATYTAALSDYYILCDPSGAAFQVTIPNAVGNRGQEYRIKHKSGSANAVTVATNGGNIDGSATKVLSSLQSIDVVSDGTNWFIL